MKKIILSILALSLALGVLAQRSESKLEVGQRLADLKFKDSKGKEFSITELGLKDPNGKTIKLSEVKNKVILVDFWASWCRPCRIESPYLKTAYSAYSNKKSKTAKGFEIYSVSIDRNSEAWKKAIKDDELNWLSQVIVSPSDPVNISEVLNIQYIPQNYLLDAKGFIIAKNLRGADLELELKKIFQSR